MSKLTDAYTIDLKNKKILYDDKQALIINELEILTTVILKKELNKENIFFSDIFNFFKKEESLGLYIWGDVGRGKTYLVNLFFTSLTSKKKIRLHYHHFMKLIHTQLNEHTGNKNPLKIIAEILKKNYTVICLDEFFVKDIADAMQLAKLFYYLFQSEIYFIITSNIIPNKLYDGGLQRQKFLPTINLLEKHLKIINIDGKIDYRYNKYEKEHIFFTPLSIKTFKSMKRFFLKLSSANFERKKYITILDRKILSLYLSETIIWFDFKIICGQGRSQLDYIELASLFDTIFISNIKIMTNNDEDIARRFIILIDELYDRKINLAISSESSIEYLYKGNTLIFDFKRTISRLTEMSTKNYLKEFDKNVF
ncbi:MAG TPA: cell division protein ZapE [Candidatus Azoamicus sp. OHIO2]